MSKPASDAGDEFTRQMGLEQTDAAIRLLEAGDVDAAWAYVERIVNNSRLRPEKRAYVVRFLLVGLRSLIEISEVAT